ncbi:putative ankyrin repeat protein [Cotonvirus japonicus]|uniref:Ankyrin repeat protein n=1 Tax=Cotonvirus japonicus TaxID=2811091 RepID=A0ABM7NRI9_9VIRU|nr:putative ankyrin repeat protein [Cotonvirus japonicus]BCS82771.1 putative ankyrin repeat protein [Cotonvirus japonicus]
MTCINNPIPWELWICIANFSEICDYNLFFTNKKFFGLINCYKFDSNVIKFAIKQGNLDIIKYILKLKHKKDTLIDNKRFTAIGLQKCLNLSCEFGHLEVAKFLVENGVDIQADNNYAVQLASQSGHLEIVRFLVSQGANIQSNDNCAVKWASQSGHLEVVKFLVSQGANIQAGNNHAVRWASYYGRLEVVRFLVEKGADILANDNWAIQWASFNGHIEMVKFLVEKGADSQYAFNYSIIFQ